MFKIENWSKKKYLLITKYIQEYDAFVEKEIDEKKIIIELNGLMKLKKYEDAYQKYLYYSHFLMNDEIRFVGAESLINLVS